MLGLVLVLLAPAVIVVSATGTPATAVGGATPPIDPNDWLGYLNYVRQGSGLDPVTENPAWTQGIANHLSYLDRTSDGLLAGYSAHQENHASPYYTLSGEQAGASSDISYGATDARNALDLLLAAPFHAIGMLRPQLTQSAFAFVNPAVRSYTFAGIDVIRGLGNGPTTSPVMFPGNGSTTALSRFTGEQPTPLESCPGIGAGDDPALPLVVLLPSVPAGSIAATLTGPGGRSQSSADPSQLCVVTEGNYQSSDTTYGPTGLAILQHDHGVVLIARGGFAPGTYTAQLGGYDSGSPSASLTWSFTVAGPPGRPTIGLPATFASGTTRVSWTPPASDGGSPIVAYRIGLTTGASTQTVDLPGSARSYDVTLDPTQATSVTVTAVNAYTAGPFATTSVGPKPAAGYWMAASDGRIYNFGSASGANPTGATGARVVSIDAAPNGGYWLLRADGTVATQGADFYGNVDPGSLAGGERVSAISGLPNGSGYRVFTSLGRVIAFGAAQGYGDLSTTALNGPVVAAGSTPSGNGYYLVGSDGGVFTFGDATFHGSMGGTALNQPVVGLVPGQSGYGYWLIGGDGGIFAFDVPFRGSVPAVLGPGGRLNLPVIGALPYGDGYVMVAADGGAFVFADQPFLGSLGGVAIPAPIVGLAVRK